MSFVWALLIVVAPAPWRRHIGRRLLGWEVDQTAYIGRSLIVVAHVSLGPGASIGPRNVIRGIDELRLEEGASIATRNWITGWPSSVNVFPRSPHRKPCLILGRYAMVTDAHEIDCSDRVQIHDYGRLAGFRCQVHTHNLNLVRNEFETAPVEIGELSAVMSACILLSGTRVPPRSIVSAGSVVNTKLTKELTLYRGNPAQPVRDLPPDLGYFRRGRMDGGGRAALEPIEIQRSLRQ
jgi:acetyltransferase-like isoleucine patch superfamily enzyme